MTARLTAASSERPSSRSGSLNSKTRVKVEDTLTTRGGLGSIQNSEGLDDRHQVQDQTYFVGIVRSKISELESEIQRLQREIDSFAEDNKQYIVLSKTAEDLSQQVENLRNELEDYNMARMNSFCDVTELKKEINDLNAHNQQVESTIDEIYHEKQRKEKRIQQLEYELSDEKPEADRFLENINSELKQRYNQLKSRSTQLQTERNSMQNEIFTFEDRINKIREQMSGTIIKQEALSLIEQIFELEFKHDQLINENKNLLTSEQELASIEKQIIELHKYNENLKQSSNNSIEQPTNDDIKQEKQIEEFLLSYEQTREQYLNDIKTIQKTNLTLLTLISQTFVKDNQLPIHNDYTQIKTNLNQYEIEREKSNDTLIILTEQHRKLKQDYIKLETLNQRLTDELKELKIKYIKMQEDLENFNDLENLKRKAERRKHQLTVDKINMIKQKQITQMEIQKLQSQFETIQTQLQNNETHQQFVSLEKKLQTISQILFTLDETLSSQNIQSQYEQIKRQALELVQIHNQWLIQRFKNSSIT